jgi:anti-repressor protein
METIMNNEIQPFEFEGNKVRALADGDEVMFVASDIAKILGYRDAANLTRNLDGDERGTHEVSTPSGTQNMTVLTESGLYRAILNRETAYVKNEEAQAFVKRFQRWVTHEVLPQIRRTGGYIPATDADDDMTILAKAVMIGQRTMEEQKQRIADQQSRIDELQPKASAWDNFVDIPDALSVRDSAKLLSNLGRPVGQTELFEWLDRNDWIFRENKHWSARQSRINAGHLLMVPSKSHGTHRDGTPFAFPPTVKVTRKGLALIARRFGEETLQLEYPKAVA